MTEKSINTRSKENLIQRSSIQEKIRELLKPSNKIKLVLVQQHELERINLKNSLHIKEYNFIEYLYSHYILQNKPKTYLCNN